MTPETVNVPDPEPGQPPLIRYRLVNAGAQLPLGCLFAGCGLALALGLTALGLLPALARGAWGEALVWGIAALAAAGMALVGARWLWDGIRVRATLELDHYPLVADQPNRAHVTIRSWQPVLGCEVALRGLARSQGRSATRVRQTLGRGALTQQAAGAWQQQARFTLTRAQALAGDSWYIDVTVDGPGGRSAASSFACGRE